MCTKGGGDSQVDGPLGAPSANGLLATGCVPVKDHQSQTRRGAHITAQVAPHSAVLFAGPAVVETRTAKSSFVFSAGASSSSGMEV